MIDPAVMLGRPEEPDVRVGLDASSTVDGPHLVVAPAGEVDAANADALVDIVAGARGDEGSVRVDLTAVTFMDSAMLRALLRCRADCAASGIDFKVRNASPQAQRIFEITNLESLLE